jgi:hypothetical protein
MRQLLERVRDPARLLDLGPAGRALANVRAEGGQAKAALAVDEEIDLVGE